MISPTVCADTPARRTRTSAVRRTSRIRSGLTPFDLLACRPRRGTWYGPRRPVEGLAARRGDRDDVGLAATYRRMRGGYGRGERIGGVPIRLRVRIGVPAVALRPATVS